jgi:L-fuconolactonase
MPCEKLNALARAQVHRDQMLLIDAHHHLWKYNPRDYAWIGPNMSVLKRDYLPAELSTLAKEAGVAGTVVVQARQTLEETRWLLELASGSNLLEGVVGWVPLTKPDVERDLEQLATQPKLKGVRHVLHDEPDDDYMLREDFNRGVAQLQKFGLVYDVLIFERHLKQTVEFVDRHSNQVFVIDHIAKPRIKEGILSPWREAITELARREKVYCKVSGMVTEAGWDNWTARQLQTYFDVVLSAFGPRRLMFGSDWPVLTLAATYRKWAETFRPFISGLSRDEQERICAGTATEVYGLWVSGTP